MTKQTPLRANGKPKLMCEHPMCRGRFGREAERRRHIKETHGPMTHCYVEGCKWKSRRAARLRRHLNNHHIEEMTNPSHLLVSRFLQFPRGIDEEHPRQFEPLASTPHRLVFSSTPGYCTNPNPTINVDMDFEFTFPDIVEYTSSPSQIQHSQPGALDYSTYRADKPNLYGGYHLTPHPSIYTRARMGKMTGSKPRVYRETRARRRSAQPVTTTTQPSTNPITSALMQPAPIRDTALQLHMTEQAYPYSLASSLKVQTRTFAESLAVVESTAGLLSDLDLDLPSSANN